MSHHLRQDSVKANNSFNHGFFLAQDFVAARGLLPNSEGLPTIWVWEMFKSTPAPTKTTRSAHGIQGVTQDLPTLAKAFETILACTVFFFNCGRGTGLNFPAYPCAKWVLRIQGNGSKREPGYEGINETAPTETDCGVLLARSMCFGRAVCLQRMFQLNPPNSGICNTWTLPRHRLTQEYL